MYSFKFLILPLSNLLIELTIVPNLSGVLSKNALFFLIKSEASSESYLDNSLQYLRRVSALKSTKIFFKYSIF
jgi:hypothetical protein